MEETAMDCSLFRKEDIMGFIRFKSGFVRCYIKGDIKIDLGVKTYEEYEQMLRIWTSTTTYMGFTSGEESKHLDAFLKFVKGRPVQGPSRTNPKFGR